MIYLDYAAATPMARYETNLVVFLIAPGDEVNSPSRAALFHGANY
ncbi:MAG: hypothetical protein ABI220_04055 [Candidatus Saccharimonadales bacterium]